MNTDFVGSTNTINICLILSTFTVLFQCGWVGMGLSALLCLGAYDAVKTSLNKPHYRSDESESDPMSWPLSSNENGPFETMKML